jgi:lysophospholipase L1-like esterase
MNILRDLRLPELVSSKKQKLIRLLFGSNDIVQDDYLTSPSLTNKIKIYLSSKGYNDIDVPTDFFMEINDDYIEIIGTYGDDADKEFAVMATLSGDLFDHRVGSA